MPGSTPVYGITYPCGTDTIDASVFQTFSQTLDAAFVAAQAELDAATNKPSAQIYATSLNGSVNVVIATDTTLTFAVEVYDNNGMASLAVNNDRLTIQTGGVYWVELFTQISGYTTLTSITGILRVNGVDFYRYKSRALAIASDGFAHFSMPVNLNPGDFLQGRVRWTGTGGPGSADIRRLSASMLVAH